jgi:restriction endonuclease
MQFRFDANQSYQQRAVASVVDLFEGMDTEQYSSRIRLTLGTVEQHAERLQLDPRRLFKNLRLVQAMNQMPLDDEVRLIS